MCQLNNNMALSPVGLLQSLPFPHLIWEDISMDFIEGLLKSEDFDSLLVVVDRLSKYSHFIPLKHPYTASGVAAIVVKEVVKLHGIFRSIILDRDKIFLSHFWTKLFRLQGNFLQKSTAYHPQTDEQTEVVNRYLEAYLQCFAYDKPRVGTNGCHGRSIGTIPPSMLLQTLLLFGPSTGETPLC